MRAGRLLLTAEVTLGELAAANPEYADFHCVMRMAAACFCALLMGVRAHVCVYVCALFFDFIVGRGQSAGHPLTIPTPARQQPSVHALLYNPEADVWRDLEYQSRLFKRGFKKQNRRGSSK